MTRKHIAANRDGLLATEVVDHETLQHPYLKVGPDYTRHKLTLAVRMPDENSAYRIPTPFGFDPDTIRFEPIHLIALVPPPLGVTMKIDHVSTARGQVRAPHTEIHAWDQLEGYGLRQGVTLLSPKLKAGDWIEMACTSRCYRPVSIAGITPRPNSVQTVPWRAALIIRACWMPLQVGEDVTVVDGNPLDHLVVSPQAPPPTPSLPLDPDRLFDPENTFRP